MRGRWIFGVAVAFLTVVMVGLTVIALVQEDVDWGWWWVVPIAGGIILAVLGFRIMVHLATEAAERADRELDDAEAHALPGHEDGDPAGR